jgi:hypothetical protein
MVTALIAPSIGGQPARAAHNVMMARCRSSEHPPAHVRQDQPTVDAGRLRAVGCLPDTFTTASRTAVPRWRGGSHPGIHRASGVLQALAVKLGERAVGLVGQQARQDGADRVS